ncbi:MAG: prepilin peptidase [Acidobacteriota bacterium]|nr:prepilin peptidase [Acidobacteriota bacterium]
MGTIFAALTGLAFGSFLNVCLSRWPAGESVVRPRSHCRNCGHVLTWWENVPLASWLALRGRCRACKAWIGWRYPLVELAVGALWGWQAWTFLNAAFNPELPSLISYQAVTTALGRIILYWLLVALAVLDAEHLWLPNWLTLPGTALGFVFTLLGAGYDRSLLRSVPPEVMRFSVAREAISSLIAMSAAAGLILLIRWTYRLVRGHEGMGLGDAKLMALLGAWLGLPGALVAFALAVLMGAAASLALLALPAARRGPEHWTMIKLPLGTFLCIGGVASALWGQQLVTLYLRSLGLG